MYIKCVGALIKPAPAIMQVHPFAFPDRACSRANHYAEFNDALTHSNRSDGNLVTVFDRFLRHDLILACRAADRDRPRLRGYKERGHIIAGVYLKRDGRRGSGLRCHTCKDIASWPLGAYLSVH